MPSQVWEHLEHLNVAPVYYTVPFPSLDGCRDNAAIHWDRELTPWIKIELVGCHLSHMKLTRAPSRL